MINPDGNSSSGVCLGLQKGIALPLMPAGTHESVFVSAAVLI